MNVWPPKGFDDARDPFDGDHFAVDWAAALSMVEEYAGLLAAPATPPDSN